MAPLAIDALGQETENVMARSHLISSVHPTERLVGEAPAIGALRGQIRHLAAFDTLGNPFVPILFPWVASSLGVAYALSGRVPEGLPLLEQAVELAASMGFIPYVSSALAALSEGYLHANRLDDALPLAQRALKLAREHNERGHQAGVLRLLGEIAVRRAPAEVEPAEDHYRQALALADTLGMRPLQAHCHHGLGTLYARMGRREQARAELSDAIGLYRAMDMTFWLPQAEAALAQAVALG